MAAHWRFESSEQSENAFIWLRTLFQASMNGGDSTLLTQVRDKTGTDIEKFFRTVETAVGRGDTDAA